MLLRTAADKTGLTRALGKVFGSSLVASWVDRAEALVYLACAIALGAKNFSDAERMAHHHRVLGLSGGSDSTIWRLLDSVDERCARRVARARAAARKIAWGLIAAREQGFPWVEIAGKTLTGWIVIDMDATIVEASSAKEGAAGTFKGTFGHHPLAAWCANTFECLSMLLRPGNAGSNNAADHRQVFTAALRQLPRTGYRKILVRVDGAGATHALVDFFEGLNHAARRVVYTVGWTITGADERAIGALPESAWTVAVATSGEATPGYATCELTGLNTRPGWPKNLRLIVRRCKPSRRQAKKLTDFEQATGFVYAIVATNIGLNGIKGVPGSHTAQFIDVLHRHHAVVEDRVRCNKAMGMRNLPSHSWKVNAAWILAANLAADLDAWTRLLGCAGETELERAEPDTIRAKLYAIPAKLARHARRRTLRLADTWPWSPHFRRCWQRLTALPDPRPDRTPHPANPPPEGEEAALTSTGTCLAATATTRRPGQSSTVRGQNGRNPGGTQTTRATEKSRSVRGRTMPVKYPQEVRNRTVRLVLDRRDDSPAERAAISAIARERQYRATAVPTAPQVTTETILYHGRDDLRCPQRLYRDPTCFSGTISDRFMSIYK